MHTTRSLLFISSSFFFFLVSLRQFIIIIFWRFLITNKELSLKRTLYNRQQQKLWGVGKVLIDVMMPESLLTKYCTAHPTPNRQPPNPPYTHIYTTCPVILRLLTNWIDIGEAFCSLKMNFQQMLFSRSWWQFLIKRS